MSEEKKNKIFWLVFFLAIVVSIVLTYIRIFVRLDYMLLKEVSCNPDTESCFSYSPEELCVDSEEENCLENKETEYYKIIHKKAANVPVCDGEDGQECEELVCVEWESEDECYYEYNEQDQDE